MNEKSTVEHKNIMYIQILHLCNETVQEISYQYHTSIFSFAFHGGLHATVNCN